jgi:hypothetical protein
MRVVVAMGLSLAACGGPPTPEGTIIVPEANVGELLLDGASLYWENDVDGGIFAFSIDPLGSTPTTLVDRTAVQSAAAGSPTSIAIADDVVYWTNINQATRSGGSVWSVPASGGTPTVLVAGLDQPSGIVVDGANVYFIDDNVLYVTSTQGGSFTSVGSDVQEFHIASGNGYWTSTTTPDVVFALDLATPQATPTMIPTGVIPLAFTVDDSNLYLRSTEPDDQLDVVVTEVPISGGGALTLFDGFIDDGAFAEQVVLSGSDVYWNARTAILKIGIDGSGLTRPVQNDVDIRSLVIADDAIYFATTRNDAACICPVIVKLDQL